MSDESEKANVDRRRLLLAGTALPVLSIAGCGAQLQQAQAQAPTRSTAPATGNVVMVDPSDAVVAIQTKLNSVPAGGTLAFPANSTFNFNSRTVRAKSGITVLANGPVTINGAPGPGTGGAFDFGGMSNWTVRGNACDGCQHGQRTRQTLPSRLEDQGHVVSVMANVRPLRPWADGVVTINGAPGARSAGAFDFGGMLSWTIRGRAPGQGFVSK